MISYVNAIIGNIVLSFSVMIASRIIIKENKIDNRIKFLLITILAGVAYGLVSIFMYGIPKTMLCVFAQAIVIVLQFRINFLKALFISILYMVLLIPAEIFIIIFFKLINISSYYCYEVFADGFIANLSVSLIFILFVLLLRKPLNKLVNLHIDESKKNIIYILLTFVCVAIFVYNFIFIVGLNKETIISICSIIIFIIVISSFLKERINNNNLSEKYDKLWEYMKVFEKEIEKQRIYNHEIKNQFLTIKSICLETKDNKEVRKYVEDVLGDERTIMNEEYAKFVGLPANGLKGLLYFKCDEAKEKGINVSVMVSNRIKKSGLDKLTTNQVCKLCKLLGIYIDNAIEASAESEKKNLGIEVFVNEGNVIFIVSNNYKGVISDNIGKKSFSTKGKNRGHGLLLAKSILDSSRIFEAKREFISDLYVQKLIIKNLNDIN